MNEMGGCSAEVPPVATLRQELRHTHGTAARSNAEALSDTDSDEERLPPDRGQPYSRNRTTLAAVADPAALATP